jgi:hypothetical protein
MTDIQARKEGDLVVVDLPQVPTGTGGITKDAQPDGVALNSIEHPHLGKPSKHKISKKSLETMVLETEWVALTDEEIEGAIDEGFAFGLDDGNVSNKYVIRYARIIEAKLKEKNT